MTSQIRQKFKELHFTGGRFEEAEGFLDFDVLHELEVYKRILVETAKEVWRAQHPDRRNLPSGFEARLRLGIAGRIGEGSCTVSLERISSVGDDQKPMDGGDEFDEAGDLVDEALRALTTDSWFPSNMPKSVLPMFNEWGRTLGEEESIALGENIDDAPMYNAAISKRLKARLSQPGGYTGRCELSGEIRAASLRADESGTFTIRRDDGLTLSGVFADDQKSDLIGALRDHEAVRVWLTGEGEYGMDGELVKILRVDSYNIVPVGEVPFDPDAPSILDIVDEIRASMSETAFESMPTDGSINLKHYLYGWPKEQSG